MVHDHLQQVCHSHGGMLPEPRSEGENQFLDNLGSDVFPLGMTDRKVEGQWIWDSDQSPVIYTSWYVGQSLKKAAPKRGTDKNCALMIRRYGGSTTKDNHDDWADYACDEKLETTPKSLVCQRPGMCTLPLYGFFLAWSNYYQNMYIECLSKCIQCIVYC